MLRKDYDRKVSVAKKNQWSWVSGSLAAMKLIGGKAPVIKEFLIV
jgi:hypothetical protein